MPMEPNISGPLSATLKSLLANAEKINAGARIVMLIRLTMAMSGFTRRA